MLGEADKLALQQLLVREDTLSGLAALKQDAKHFGYHMMLMERQKRTAIEPVYRLMKKLLPALAISQQNLNYYANLAHYYTIYDLRRMKPEQVHEDPEQRENGEVFQCVSFLYPTWISRISSPKRPRQRP